MSYGGLTTSILLNATSRQQVKSSGFPVAAAAVLIGLILVIVIWDIVKARRETRWTDEVDEENEEEAEEAEEDRSR